MSLTRAFLSNLRPAFLAGCTFLAAVAAPAQTTNRAPGRPDFSAFKLVTDRNIFDPARRGTYVRPTRERPTRSPVRAEYFILTGTMSYDEKGPLAFFKGSKSEYWKVLKPSETIAGYKVKAVGPTFATLASGTNEFSLPVGMQLRREQDGPWRMSEASPSSYDAPSRGASYRTSSSVASAPGAPPSGTNAEPDAMTPDADTQPLALDSETDMTDTNAPPAAPGGGETDPVLLKLMQKRAKDLNQ